MIETTQTMFGPNRLVTRDELANLIGVSAGTLRNWSHQGEGPRVTRVGVRGARYELREVERWLREVNTPADERVSA